MGFKVGDVFTIHGTKNTSAYSIRMGLGVPSDLPEGAIFTVTDIKIDSPVDTYTLTYSYCDRKLTVDVYSGDLGMYFQKCRPLETAIDEPQGSEENTRVYTVTSCNTIHGFTIGQEIVILLPENEVISGGRGIVSDEFLERDCTPLSSLEDILGGMRLDNLNWKNLHSWVKHHGPITQELLESIDTGLPVYGVYTYIGSGLGDWFENSEEARDIELVSSMRCLTDSSGFLLKSSDLRGGVFLTELTYRLDEQNYTAIITPETLEKLFVKGC